MSIEAGPQWFTPVILATQENRDQKDHGVNPAWANSSLKPYLEKTHHEKGLVEWLKVQALSSSLSTAKN
jgi:hypothetical protein